MAIATLERETNMTIDTPNKDVSSANEKKQVSSDASKNIPPRKTIELGHIISRLVATQRRWRMDPKSEWIRKPTILTLLNHTKYSYNPRASDRIAELISGIEEDPFNADIPTLARNLSKTKLILDKAKKQ